MLANKRSTEPAAGSYSGWPSQAIEVVEGAIDRHGRARWQRGGMLSFVPKNLTGLVPRVKGVGKTFPMPSRIDVHLQEWRAVFQDYPAAGHHGEFQSGRVRLFAPDGTTTLDSANHRLSFSGRRKYRRWAPADALYFFGYALTYYHEMPFVLGRTRFRARKSKAGRHAVTVEFPPEIHTHCPVQTIFFDETGLICRHDYTADIAGIWARGCHHWLKYEEVDGLMIATERDVRASFFGFSTPFVALHVTFEDVRLEGEGL